MGRPLQADFTNTTIGKLKVVEWGRDPDTQRGAWVCICACGMRCYKKSSRLKTHKTCGTCESNRCNNEMTRERNRKHGLSNHPLYGLWTGIKQRCSDRRHIGWDWYGGRGVRVCAGLRESFPLFLRLVGGRPSAGHSVDRVSSDGHYSCGECEECVQHGWILNIRWATHDEQQNNRCNSRHLTHDGRTLTYSQWSRVTGLDERLIATRLAAGWSVARALTEPVRTHPGSTPIRERITGLRWSILHRCYNEKCKQFRYYGERGITVCQRWRESIDAFYDDVTPRPKGMSLDRYPDNDGGYWCGKPECPECGPLGRRPNWRWATRKQQRENMRPAKRNRQIVKVTV